MSDRQLSNTEEFQRLDRTGQLMIQKIGELVIVVQDKLLSPTTALKVLDIFVENITVEYNKQGDAVKAMMKKYMDFCVDARRLIVQVKNTQN